MKIPEWTRADALAVLQAGSDASFGESDVDEMLTMLKHVTVVLENKIESSSAGRHDWKLQGSAGIWESYYKCSKCEKPARLANDGPDFLPVEGCTGPASEPKSGSHHGINISERVKDWGKDFGSLRMYGVPLTEVGIDDLKATIVFMTRNPALLFLLAENKERENDRS